MLTTTEKQLDKNLGNGENILEPRSSEGYELYLSMKSVIPKPMDQTQYVINCQSHLDDFTKDFTDSIRRYEGKRKKQRTKARILHLPTLSNLKRPKKNAGI